MIPISSAPISDWQFGPIKLPNGFPNLAWESTWARTPYRLRYVGKERDDPEPVYVAAGGPLFPKKANLQSVFSDAAEQIEGYFKN